MLFQELNNKHDHKSIILFKLSRINKTIIMIMKVDNNIVEYFPSSYCEPLACYFKNLRKYNQSG